MSVCVCVCVRERERAFAQYPNMTMKGSFPSLTNHMVLKDVNERISLRENKLEKKKNKLEKTKLLRIKQIKEIPESSLLLTKKLNNAIGRACSLLLKNTHK